MVKKLIKINDLELSKALGIQPLGVNCFYLEIDSNQFESCVPWNKGLKGVQTPWNKGTKGKQTVTSETKNKLRAANLGKKLSVEHKRKIGAANKISKLGSIPANKGKKADRNKRKNWKTPHTYEIVHPNGKIEKITNLSLWCDENGIKSKGCMCGMLNGHKLSFLGYTGRKII